jgi:hypothetical protein
MAGTRPTSVTVMGILNIVFGSLSLLGSLCNGISIILNTAGVRMGGRGPEGDIGGHDLWKAMAAEVPGFVAFEYGSLLLTLALGLLLLLTGIGLLNMRSWARTGAVLYAPVKIVFEVGALIYTMVLVNPVQARWMEAEMARGGVQGGGNIMAAAVAVVAIVSAAVAIGYAIILLIVMLRPTVREAFAPFKSPSLEQVLQDEGDEYERQRRSPWDY